jgi:hypothetical protein
MSEFFLDGDFSVEEAECKYYCSPTCHPAQTDKHEWKYGCLNSKHPHYDPYGFCPIVKCGGRVKDCEIPKLQRRK